MTWAAGTTALILIFVLLGVGTWEGYTWWHDQNNGSKGLPVCSEDGPVSVPEPSALFLLVGGVALLGKRAREVRTSNG
jgi:hypothetical protein